MYFVYVLKSLKDGKFYIGQTSNLEDRICRHNEGREKSTKNRRPFELVYFEIYDSRSEAVRRENYIKSLKSHDQILMLIDKSRQQQNDIEDISRDF